MHKKRRGFPWLRLSSGFPPPKYSKGMGLLKHVLPICYSSLLCLQQRSALSYLLLSALQCQLRNQYIFAKTLLFPSDVSLQKSLGDSLL